MSLRALLVALSLTLALPEPALGAGAPPPAARPKDTGREPAKKKSDDHPLQPKRKRKKVPPKNALRLQLGGASRLSSEEMFAPGSYSLLGADVEIPKSAAFSYAPGVRFNNTAVDTSMWEILVTGRYKFGTSKDTLQPYVIFGLGVPIVSSPVDTTLGLEARVGGGVSYRVTKWFRVGVDVTGGYHFYFTSALADGAPDDFGLIQVAVAPEFRF